MAAAGFRFYGELNDFLSPDSRGKQAKRHFDGTRNRDAMRPMPGA